MLEQLQRVPFSRGSSFTGAVPDCEQPLPFAESTMESDDFLSAALDDVASSDVFSAHAFNNSDWAVGAVSDAAMLANPLMDTIVGQEGDAAFVSLASGYFFQEPQQWIDPTQSWSDPTPELPLHATAQPLGPSITAPTLGPFANAAGLARVRGSQSTQLTYFANQKPSTHNVS